MARGATRANGPGPLRKKEAKMTLLHRGLGNIPGAVPGTWYVLRFSDMYMYGCFEVYSQG